MEDIKCIKCKYFPCNKLIRTQQWNPNICKKYIKLNLLNKIGFQEEKIKKMKGKL